MATDVVMREPKLDDTETLVEIALAAWEPIYASYRQMMGDDLFTAVIPDWRAEKGRQIREMCQPGSRMTVAVAEVAGQIVGFVSFYADQSRGVGVIGNNAVHPAWQNRGIAQAMYAHVFAQLRQHGMRAVRVNTGGDPSHAPARRAYEKAGFAVGIPCVDYYRKL